MRENVAIKKKEREKTIAGRTKNFEETVTLNLRLVTIGVNEERKDSEAKKKKAAVKQSSI